MSANQRLRRQLMYLLAVMLLTTTVLAAGRIDLTAEVGLTLTYQDGETALSGAAFRLYRVAAVDETGALTVLQDFQDYHVDITGEDPEAWRTLAVTLEGYVLRDSLRADDSGQTDERGRLSFPTAEQPLEQGLYLVLGTRHTQGGYEYDAAPFMVLLPGHDKENGWAYQIEAAAKFVRKPTEDRDTVQREVVKVWNDDGKDRPVSVTVELLRNGAVYDTVTLSDDNQWHYVWSALSGTERWSVAEQVPEGYTVSVRQEGSVFIVTNSKPPEVPVPPEEPAPPVPTETPKGPTLPQTGQLWWPLPLLLCGGGVLMCIGRRRKAEDER